MVLAGLAFGVGIGLVAKAIYRRGMATPKDSRAIWAWIFPITMVVLVFAVRAIGDYYFGIVERAARGNYMGATLAGIFLGFFAAAPLIWRRRDP